MIMKWAGGALIRNCVVGLPEDTEAISLDWDPCYLVGPDSEQYSPTDWRDIKMPDRTDDPDQGYDLGEGAKGWIIFESGADKVAAVRYRPDSGETASWNVG